MSRSRALAMLFALLALAAAAMLALREVARLDQGALAVGPSGFVLEVEPGSGPRRIGRMLAEAGVMQDADDLWWAAKIWGGAGALKAGEYRIAPGTSVRGLLAQLREGRVLLHRLTIVEGTSLAELRRGFAQSATLVATLAEVGDDRLMAALGLPPGPAEGRFLPDTYAFARGSSDADLLRQANAALERALAEAWQGRAAGLPLRTPAELLVLASIVEKETGVPEERSQIAGVFVRRLARGMRLQTDPSVIYGLGARFDGNLRRRDLDTDGPFNTYTRAGLPPTPICAAGRAALQAAAHPAGGDALYFVADGSGGHTFSATYAEHAAAVRRLVARSRGR
jgi:UPF0755 protein